MSSNIPAIDTINSFAAILGDLVRDKGAGVLHSPQLKPLLSDYTRREYKNEARLFLRLQDSLCAEKIMAASPSDLDSVALSLVQFLQDEYALSEFAACFIIEALSSSLRGVIPASITATPSNLKSQAAAPLLATQFSAHSSVNGGFVQIAPGSFIMGGDLPEVPKHSVAVGAFAIAQSPVTQAEFFTVMGYNPSYSYGADFPVEGLSWYEAVEYCNSRSVYDGLTPVYIIDKTKEAPPLRVLSWGDDPFNWIISADSFADGYRLPSEAEWEYTCRAGTLTDYNTGNQTLPLGAACMKSCSPAPVGSFPPNNWGLYDMHGNINEWCSNRTNDGRCYYRGGSYRDNPNSMRSWKRGDPQRPWRTAAPAFIWSADYTDPHGGFIGPYGIRLVKN
ncbi:formylglycine-generating enzyme family protein [Treponema primitia]|uniref:formylglycine-generating enzyme family protein n=1 Tax=Treponema primitia TaxID=88058 RepID=UPI0002555805|nr:SUMF1/EgtB/PvdO family nonheme iron enzyme [Treponema primitia]